VGRKEKGVSWCFPGGGGKEGGRSLSQGRRRRGKIGLCHSRGEEDDGLGSGTILKLKRERVLKSDIP